MPHDPQKSNEISSAVIDYPARDMTITVDAGMPVSDLCSVLQQENQQLPIDTTGGEITIRELVDFDISGPRQFGYGTLRDYVIGIEARDGHGRVFHAGGRVVKNVAGYDLCRLLIGARGQLGTLQQLTVKLKPLPAAQCLSIAAFRSLKDLAFALDRINLTSTSPQILDVVNHLAAAEICRGIDLPQDAARSLFLLVLGFDGSRAACEWQSRMIAEELHGTAVSAGTVAESEATTRYCQAAMRFSKLEPSTGERWLARVVTPPSQVRAVLEVADEFGLLACGRAGNGIMDLRPGPSSVDAVSIRTRLGELADRCAGFVEFQTPGETWKYPAAATTVERYSEALRKLLG